MDDSVIPVGDEGPVEEFSVAVSPICHSLSDEEIPSGVAQGEIPSDHSYMSEEMKDPISTDEEDNDIAAFPQYNETAKFGNVAIELGMEFDTLASFKQAVKEYTINLGRQIKWVKNDSVRARAKCKEDGCPWEIYCAKNTHRGSYQVKTFSHQHECHRNFKSNQADRKWVVKKLEDRLRSHPKMTHVEVFDFMKQEYNVLIDRSMIFRALREARELIEGSEREQYGMIWDYANELSRSNPGSLIKVDTIPQPEYGPIFQRFFVCIDACKRGFKAGCRPFIGLDGCFLKGYFGGQLLSAIATDANNHICILAYAFVDVENKDNWKWFLTLLHEHIGDYRQYGWNFMSDMHKGLIPAMQEVMPGVPHRFCAMHLWRNFTKQWKEKELRGVVWTCSKSTTPTEFNMHMEHVKRLNLKAWEYLNKWPIWSGDGPGVRFEVQKYPIRVDVNLASRTCTCRFWQLTGMPCMHACAAIAYKAQKPEDYCHGWLTIGAYKATYESFVQPTQSQMYWTRAEHIRPKPPHVKRSTGRPKKNRRKDADEGSTSGKKLRKTVPIWVCTRCGQSGHHNSRGCTNQGVDMGPLSKRTRLPKVRVTQSEVELSQSIPIESQDPIETTVEIGTGSHVVDNSCRKGGNSSENTGRRYGMRGPVIPYQETRAKSTSVRPILRPKSTPVRPNQSAVASTLPQATSSGPIPQPPPWSTIRVRGEQMFQFIPTPPGLYQIRPRQL